MNFVITVHGYPTRHTSGRWGVRFWASGGLADSIRQVQTPIDPAGLSPDVVALLEGRWASLGAALDWRADATPHDVGWKYPDADEAWQDLTWGEFRDQVHVVAAGLHALGVGPGDKVAIAATTSMKWVIADFANGVAGFVTTTIYLNTRDEDVEFCALDSDSRVAFVEDAAFLSRFESNPALLASVRRVVVMNGGYDGALAGVLTWDELLRRGRHHLARHPGVVRDLQAATGPDTLATIIYTSGTTGRPKGVELTHDNWCYLGTAWASRDIVTADDLHYLWLPLAHAFGKCLLLVTLHQNCPSAIDGRVDRLVANLKAVRPTAMCGVPRIFEKVRAGVLTAVPSTHVKARISRWAFAVGRSAYPYRSQGRRLPLKMAAQYALADRLVFSKIRELLGGRIRFLISGSAKLSPQVQEWFHSFGIVIAEGYGITEAGAVNFFEPFTSTRFGYVGRVAPGMTATLAEDGEVLLRGPAVMRGYHGDPELTAQIMTDGWLHTGDIGEFDADGFLRITDRKKDMIKTSGGKFVSPAEVESVVMANCPYASHVVVVGEGRKYVAALLALDAEKLHRWAERRGLTDLSYGELAARPEIRRSIERFITRANRRLGQWETIKQFAILPNELSVESGEVTPTLKVRRKAVLERYADLVDSLYPD